MERKKLLLGYMSMLLLLACTSTQAEGQTTTTSLICNYQNCTTTQGCAGYCYWGTCYPIVACHTQSGCRAINYHDCVNYNGGAYINSTGCEPDPCAGRGTTTTTTRTTLTTTTTTFACNYENCTTSQGQPGYCYWDVCYPIVACCTQVGCIATNYKDCMNYYGGVYKAAGSCDPNPCVTTTSQTTTTRGQTTTTLAQCPSYYWFDDQSNKSCGYKQFCGDYEYSGLRVYNSSEQCIQQLYMINGQKAENCTTLYWFDEQNNASCAYKQFCGEYVYQGLKVYVSAQACYGNRTNKPVHNIDTGRNYYSIRAAIYDNSTLDGHTITVEPGVYYENTEIFKSLNIWSTSGTPNNTIIHAPNWDRHTFDIIADNVNISGFSFKGKRSYLHAFFPIPPGGIYLHRADGSNISNNVFDELTVGISLEDSSRNTIRDNAFRNTGMQVWYQSHDNTVAGNTVNGKPLVYLEGVTGTTVTDAGQVILVRCREITVSGLTIGNTSNAIRMLETNDSTITGNMLRDDNHDGLHISRSQGNVISGNGFKGNVRNGIHMFMSTENTVSGNLLRNNRGNGLHLEKSSGNTIRDNDILYSSQGIILWDRSENNTLANNTVGLTMRGLTFAPYSTGNAAEDNMICRNTAYDIMSGGSNAGSDNACRIAVNWNDAGATGCARICPGVTTTTTTTTPTSTRPCVEEGRKAYWIQNQTCCQGLKGITPWQPMPMLNGSRNSTCIAPPDGSVICTRCGDGVCGAGENRCDCPQDCNNQTTCSRNLNQEACAKTGGIWMCSSVSCYCQCPCARDSDCGIDRCGQGGDTCIETKFRCVAGVCNQTKTSYANYSCSDYYIPKPSTGGKCQNLCGDHICSLYEPFWCPQDCSANCAKENERVYNNEQLGPTWCCNTGNLIKPVTTLTNGQCLHNADGNRGLCVSEWGHWKNCGNGICEEGENKCNCPRDCNYTGTTTTTTSTTAPSTTTPCVAEGSKAYWIQNQSCCGGLTAITPSQPTLTETGSDSSECVATNDGSALCTNCGDGTCGAGENACNCPTDCDLTTTTTTTTTATTSSTTVPEQSTRLWIERSIPEGASNGTTQTITLEMTVNQSDTPLVVGLTEYYPSSWSVTGISASGIAKDGRIEWLFSSLTTPVNDTTITYSVEIPKGASGNYTFSGTAQTEDNTVETAGDDAISVGEGTGCSLTGDTPPCGEVTLGEVVAMITDWASGEASLGDTVNLIGAWASSL